MTYNVKQYFEINPKAEKAFETADLVMHTSEEAAKEWNATHANQIIEVYENPAFAKAEEATEPQA